MSDPSILVRLCGLLAPVASVLVCMSPIPTITKIVRERQVGPLPLLPYSTMVINSTLWFSYGLLKRNASIWSCNGIGMVLGIYYLVNFIQFAPPSSATLPGKVQDHHIAVVGTLVGVVLIIVLPILDDPAWIIGKVGLVVCVLLFASPLSVLHHVIVSKSAKSIPLPFSIASMVNCFLWSVFGLWEVDDSNVYIPNVLGLAFSFAQLGLKIYFDEDMLLQFRKIIGGSANDELPLSVSQRPLTSSGNAW